jgi:hypothetical protein
MGYINDPTTHSKTMEDLTLLEAVQTNIQNNLKEHKDIAVAKEIACKLATDNDIIDVCNENGVARKVYNCIMNAVSKITANENFNSHMQCAFACHIIGDTLNSMQKNNSAVGLYYATINMYEKCFKKMQDIIREGQKQGHDIMSYVSYAYNIANRHATCCCNLYSSFTKMNMIVHAIESAKHGLILKPPLESRFNCMSRIVSALYSLRDFVNAKIWLKKIIDEYNDKKDTSEVAFNVSVQECYKTAVQCLRFYSEYR